MLTKRYALALWLLALAGCFDAGDNAGKPAAASIMAPCPGFAETGKPALVYGAQCGELKVKENPADAQSAEIAVAILRLPAINPAPKQDPLFLIQGGPGGSSVLMAEQIHQVFADVRKNRDLVFVDQRGTGKSNPLNCDSLGDAEQLLPEAEQHKKYLELMRACAAKYAAQIPYYTTPYAVADLEAVRQALGYEQINLWGGSYGSRVVLEYMRAYPQQLRTVVMDGLAPAQIALPKFFAEDAQAALAAVNRECAQQPKCLARYGDILAHAQTVHKRLQQLQAQAKPLRIHYEHPRHRQPKELLLTPKSFSSLVFMSLYSRDLTVLLPQALYRAAKEDYRLLAALHALAAEQSSFSQISEGMRYSVLCNEDARFITAHDLRSRKPFLGLDMLADFADVCNFWPEAEVPVDYFVPLKSALPSLLLSGGHDPVTPQRWAQQVAEGLSQATQLAAPGGNHIVSMEGCLPQVIAQFIEQGGVGDMKLDCVQRIKPLPLTLGANEDEAASASSAASASKVSAASSSSANFASASSASADASAADLSSADLSKPDVSSASASAADSVMSPSTIAHSATSNSSAGSFSIESAQP